MAYCIRCGYKCSAFKSMILREGSICKDCLDELGITSEEKSRYTSMAAPYELVLADLRFNNPGKSLPDPGERTGDDYQSPPEMPNVRTYDEMLDEYYIKDPGINLDFNEKCYFRDSLTLSYKENVTVVTGGGNYSGFSLDLGLGIHYGLGGRSPEKTKSKNVTTSMPTTFHMTSKRFYFRAEKQYFSIYYRDIDSITWNIKSFDVISGADNLKFSTLIMPVSNIERIYYLIQQKNKEDALAASERANSWETARKKSDIKKRETEAIKLIREYKKLLDEGILTQEEFDRKKRQILDI